MAFETREGIRRRAWVPQHVVRAARSGGTPDHSLVAPTDGGPAFGPTVADLLEALSIAPDPLAVTVTPLDGGPRTQDPDTIPMEAREVPLEDQDTRLSPVPAAPAADRATEPNAATDADPPTEADQPTETDGSRLGTKPAAIEADPPTEPRTEPIAGPEAVPPAPSVQETMPMGRSAVRPPVGNIPRIRYQPVTPHEQGTQGWEPSVVVLCVLGAVGGVVTAALAVMLANM